MGDSFINQYKPPQIALICGGYTQEDEISYKSADFFLEQTKESGIDFVRVELRSPKKWVAVFGGDEATMERSNFTYKDSKGKINCFDAALICAHGTPGEDGKIQAYLELLNIPFVGCNSTVSAVLFHKFFTNSIVDSLGINTPRRWLITQNSSSKILDDITFPCIIKPNEGGSSLGMFKIDDDENLRKKIQENLQIEKTVLLESFITGREFSVGVYAKESEEPEVLPITEIEYTTPFFDYAAKYENKSVEITPADIEVALAEELSTISVKLYKAFACRHLVRIDFIWCEKRDKPFFLEINTIPGLSSKSIIPQQIKAGRHNFAEMFVGFIAECIKSR